MFTPTQLGDIELSNRILMAPMTRSRAGKGDAPTELNELYYAQRASAGLIITEGVQPSANGKGYCRTPGIYTPLQIAGWKKVNAAVSAKGGNLVMQIMHCGRIGTVYNKDEGSETVAPSRLKASGKIYSDTHGMVEFDTPRALETSEIPRVIEEYRQATKNAFNCGFVGVELHGTSGYLPIQFMSTSTNKRTDGYGGSVQNRIRFTVEVLEAMASVKGAGRVGIRICPGNPFNDTSDDNPQETFEALLDAINPLNLAYLHVIRMPSGPVDNIALVQNHYNGTVILNDSYSLAEAAETVNNSVASAISFGRYYVSNPNLVAKLRDNIELTPINNHTLYTPGAEGYTDY